MSAGVIHNQEALLDMFAEFVGTPLWRHAEMAQQAGSSSRWTALAEGARQQRSWLLVAVGVAAVAAGVLAYRRHSMAMT
jgi:hypothetical protein